MQKRLYVGNLPFDVTEDQLHELFAAHGHVVSTKLVTDFDTGQSRGFGFVEMQTEEEAEVALQKMHKATVGERQLVVSEAKPRPERTAPGGGHGRGSRGGYGQK